jgi:hypothetical protein
MQHPGRFALKLLPTQRAVGTFSCSGSDIVFASPAFSRARVVRRGPTISKTTTAISTAPIDSATDPAVVHWSRR